MPRSTKKGLPLHLMTPEELAAVDNCFRIVRKLKAKVAAKKAALASVVAAQ